MNESFKWADGGTCFEIKNSHISGRQTIVERETDKKVDLIKVRNLLLVWVTLFTPLSMNKGQLIFLSHLGRPIHCPPGSLDVFSFLLAGSGYVPSPGTAKLAVETGAWACKSMNHFLLCCLKREKLSSLKSWWEEKLYWNHTNTVRYDLSILGTPIFSSLLLAIMFTFLINFISILFFIIGKTSQMAISLVSILLFKMLKAI